MSNVSSRFDEEPCDDRWWSDTKKRNDEKSDASHHTRITSAQMFTSIKCDNIKCGEYSNSYICTSIKLTCYYILTRYNNNNNDDDDDNNLNKFQRI